MAGARRATVAAVAVAVVLGFGVAVGAAMEDDGSTSSSAARDLNPAPNAVDIGTMRGYLTLWQAPILPSGPPMTWMSDAGHHAEMATMPGMATTEEMNGLRRATGAAMDAMFLRLMLRHHEGGQAMLADAAAHANVEAVRALASRIAFHQQEESRTISTLLAATKSP
jgi:hypothetical protein